LQASRTWLSQEPSAEIHATRSKAAITRADRHQQDDCSGALRGRLLLSLQFCLAG